MDSMKFRIDQSKKALIVSTWCQHDETKVMINVSKAGEDQSIVISLDDLDALETFIGDVLDAADCEPVS